MVVQATLPRGKNTLVVCRKPEVNLQRGFELRLLMGEGGEHPTFGNLDFRKKKRRLCIAKVMPGPIPMSSRNGTEVWYPGCNNDGKWVKAQNHMLAELSPTERAHFNGSWEVVTTSLARKQIPNHDKFPAALL